MQPDNSWCTIESDPGVFTEMIENLGVPNLQVEELYSLEPGIFADLPAVHGLVFLFKWLPGTKDDRATCSPTDVFFAQQVFQNACATQAILSILLNAQNLELGTVLSEFKSITHEFLPEDKGFAIGSQPLLKHVHNSFARPEPAFAVNTGKGKKEDVFHFVSYVPVNGRLYELDGLKSGPIDLGACTDQNWLSLVTPIIQSRIDKYAQSEILFNLMAIINNKKKVYEAQIVELREKRQMVETTLEALGDMVTEEREELSLAIQDLNDKIEQLLGYVANEEAKFTNWKAENIRRRHNYIPFLFNLLTVLAEKDLLVPLIEKAKDKQKQKEKEKQEKQTEKKSESGPTKQ